jgi:serine protease Do
MDDKQTPDEEKQMENEGEIQEENHEQTGSNGETEVFKDKSTTYGNQTSHQKSPSKLKSFAMLVLAAIIGSVLTLGAVFQTNLFASNDGNPGDQVIQTAESIPTAVKPTTTTKSTADIVEDASSAIVGIVNMSKVQNPFQPTEGEVKKGIGSGVVYNVTDDATYIVTNNHVIEGASSLKISLPDGEKVDGELVGADPLTDIAVVKIKGDHGLKPLPFGDSDTLRAGDEVIAIGNPLGLELSRTVTQGIVSAMDRTITVNTSAGEWDFDVIQTDAAINPGNSGGALINSQGELIGINSLKIKENGVEGLGFAIPSKEVQTIIKELADHGKVIRPYIGIGLKSVSEIPPYYLPDLPDKIQDGAVVLSIDEQSAAAKAGIKVEDVIVSINGEKVTSDKDLRSYLYKNLAVGDKVTIDIYRNGEPQKIELTLASNEK